MNKSPKVDVSTNLMGHYGEKNFHELMGEVKDQQIMKDTIVNALKLAVDMFNFQHKSWSMKFGCKANFKWNYDEDGEKYLTVTDVNMPILTEPVAEDKVKEAEEILSKAANVKL